MVKPAARRRVAGYLRAEYSVSVSKACRVVGLHRSTCRYQSRRFIAPELLADLRQVAIERPRFGYRRITVMLRRKGWTVNHKLVAPVSRFGGCVIYNVAGNSWQTAGSALKQNEV